MSRTFKDTPIRVRENRLPLTREVHNRCRHSINGGYWAIRTTTVHHDAEWHLQPQYLFYVRDDQTHVWRDGVPNPRYYHYSEPRTREVWRCSEWDEQITEWVWKVRACDLEGGSDPGWKCTVEHYGSPSQETDARQNRRCPCCRDDRRRDPKRRAVRDELRAAVTGYNAGW